MTPQLQARGTKWLSTRQVRPTRQRVALASLLVGDGQDRSGEKVSLATVYNTLRCFCDAGLLQEITVDGTRSYFDTRMDDHPHFYWEGQGILTDAPADQLEIARLPNIPEGMEIAKVDVVVRIREKT